MPERRKMVLQNTKIRAAAFTCCLLFPQKRARTFPGGLAKTPSRISRCLRATRLSVTVSYFFYFFSIFCIQHISVSFQATSTHSRQHIPFGFCLLPELYAFIIFSFRSVLILSQVATLSSGVSRPHLTRIILIHPQARTSRSVLPAITSDISYLLNIQKPATHIRLCRPAPL